MSYRYQVTDMWRKTVFQPWVAALNMTREVVTHDLYPLRHTPIGRFQAASLETASRLLSDYPKLGFGITETAINGRTIPVAEQVLVEKPFCHLVHFASKGCENRPKVLFVAALSGHHATLATEAYTAFLPDHDVYVTDWQDARYVPVSEGAFGFEDYIRYVIDFLDVLGPDVHIIGICQAAVPVLAAVAAMSGRHLPNRPKSMVLMAGPVDVRVNPSAMTSMAERSNAALHRLLTIMRVPAGFPGVGRRVYPGQLQLLAFMSLNPKSHWRKHLNFFLDVYHHEEGAAQRHREFYDEYFAVLDITEEFFLETLERVFFDQHLAKGMMSFEGQLVNCDDIDDVPLLTVEGAEDDICMVGMTEAAHTLCTGLTKRQRKHYVQPGVGHYGVFSGSRYRKEVAPKMKEFISSHC